MSIKVAALRVRKLIGQEFLDRGLVDEEELRTALNLQSESREKIGKLLVDLGYVSEKDCLSVVSDHLGIPSVTVGGVVNLFYLAILFVFYVFMPGWKDLTNWSLVLYAVIWGLGIAWYYAWKWWNRRRSGIDVSMAYDELPPE